jgi:hypothetical protein
VWCCVGLSCLKPQEVENYTVFVVLCRFALPEATGSRKL